MKYLGLTLGLVLLAGALVPALLPRFVAPPYEIVETLDQPIEVVSWDARGLLLAEGRLVRLPGIAQLPSESEVLQQALQRGVEIDAQGNVTGLIRIHHWCGNDPCKNHLVRVNLAHLLMYFREGELTRPLPEALTGTTWEQFGIPLSEFGWRIGDYLQFVSWTRRAAAEGLDNRSAAAPN